MNASVELLLDIGLQDIGARVIYRSQQLIEQLDIINHVEILSDRSTDRLSGIVTFRSHKIENDDLYHILSKKKVLCAPRGGGVRLSPHFYTPLEQLEEVVSMVRKI